ncbi:MAG: hypothetical protein NE327_10405, partial [Lentisphaeraceae bacterium]|nr:hypothetical protein [Lentisphaeraceae bacterium]
MKKYFQKGDIDGFFGLFIDNLLQLIVIYELCIYVLGFPPDLVIQKILPGSALSILLGNLFYSYQAKKLMEKENRDDVTALPYGINTPSLFAFIFFVMAPVYFKTENTDLAWKAGLFACLLSGVMEIAGAFIGDFIRKNTPRAALLSPLAGIAITFICMGFVFRIFNNPVIALIPMFLIIITYASKITLPLRLPGGFVAMAVGIAIAWISYACGMSVYTPKTMDTGLAFNPPVWSVGDLFSLLKEKEFWGYLAIIFPMGLFNIIGSLQNLESAEAAGDSFDTKPSLLANGVGTVAASFFGSPFPTTIYIGHPGWKNMGAKASYSAINGVVIALLCFAGALTFIIKYIPIEATLGIILWIGIIMMSQSFQDTPKKHFLAVAIGLIPCLAAWAFLLINASVSAAGSNLLKLQETLTKFDIYIGGV